MATISKRTNKSGTYYYLVESARVNGKPRIVKQVYLGTVERIAKAVEQMSPEDIIPDPKLVTVYDFGAVVALYSVAQRLGVCQIINDIADKRDQGLPISATMLLAAINRAVAPASKNAFFDWFDKTVLYKIFPNANAKNLSSQGFWNNMAVLNEDKIRRIEDEITKRVVGLYEISLDCLLFDNTNFFTYLDTSNPSSLAKRGHSKQKRSDLKIVGLSLMVSPDHSIPLFHEAYPGNTNDARHFSDVISKLKNRYQMLGQGECAVTLVFDKGNNNEENIEELIKTKPCPFHFVGALRLNQCQELLNVPKADFMPLDSSFRGTSAHRTMKRVYGLDFTVLVTYNPELFSAQVDGILGNIASCEVELGSLKEKLELRAAGIITKGKKPTVESVTKRILGILSAEHMRDLFDYAVVKQASGQTPQITFSLNEEKWRKLQERSLGKTVLFTDHADWPNERIVSTYRSQYHIEDAFKQMKDTKYLSFKPLRHFTDAHIRVHAFYCVLSFMLASLLNKELEEMGHKMSIRRMLDKFQEAQQVISVFPSSKGNPTIKTWYSRFDGVINEYADKYGLLQYLA
jgi:transposase